MEDNTQTEVQISDSEDKHSCLLSKTIYKSWKEDANKFFSREDANENTQESEELKPFHPDAPLHRLSDILRKKLDINKDENVLIEEEEEDVGEEKTNPSVPRAPLSNKLIDQFPQIFKKGYSAYINSQE